MNILVLRATPVCLHAAGFVPAHPQPLWRQRYRDYRYSRREEAAGRRLLRKIVVDFRIETGAQPDLVAVHMPFAGDALRESVRFTDATAQRLREMEQEAPLHAPPLLRLLEGLHDILADTPLVLVSGAAFFADLPPRERCYALDRDLVSGSAIRRRGYHGLFHRAACAKARRALRRDGVPRPHRVLSICLEPLPELAAALDGRPAMVTSGATPLDGLPGHTTCGEVDPSIVLAMRRDLKWGPGRINHVLTRESGLLGLAGRRVTLREALTSSADDCRLAGAVLRHRFLMACGAGVAALGGVDAVVFSGRYAETGGELGPWLVERLTTGGVARRHALVWDRLTTSLERLIADEATALTRRVPVHRDTARVARPVGVSDYVMPAPADATARA